MKQCPKCGAPVSDKDDECFCGARVQGLQRPARPLGQNYPPMEDRPEPREWR